MKLTSPRNIFPPCTSILVTPFLELREKIYCCRRVKMVRKYYTVDKLYSLYTNISYFGKEMSISWFESGPVSNERSGYSCFCKLLYLNLVVLISNGNQPIGVQMLPTVRYLGFLDFFFQKLALFFRFQSIFSLF